MFESLHSVEMIQWVKVKGLKKSNGKEGIHYSQ